MSQKIISRYCKAVGKQLICLPETRQELLKGLRMELEELPPVHTDSFNRLEVCYGKIPQTVLELQEAVSAGERSMVLKKQRWKLLLLGCVAVVLFLLLVTNIIIYYCNGPSYIVTNPPAYH